jgi:hypothetical protein
VGRPEEVYDRWSAADDRIVWVIIDNSTGNVDDAIHTLPNTGPTAAQAGWKLGLSGPSALIMSCSAFES